MLRPDRLSVIVSVSVMRGPSSRPLPPTSDFALMSRPRELLSRLDLVEETVPLPARTLSILRPRSGEALARAVGERDVAGRRIVELGCGLALPSLAAALGGAQVLATDWSTDAIELAGENARRNALELLALLPRLGTEVLLAEPGRPHAKTFLGRAEAAGTWRIEQAGIV